MKITICGTGYVGLVTAVCLAEIGHEVICYDVDEKKIQQLEAGIPIIYENGLSDLMKNNKDRIIYTTDSTLAYKSPEVIFIGVGTPEKKDGSANLQYVYNAIDQIAEMIERDSIIVIKSTVPIGTNDKLEKRMNSRLKHQVKVSIASNPEFLAQGTAIHDTLHPSRIVIGTEDKDVAKILLDLYQNIEAPRIVTDRRSAEMIKYASNDFLALKISYINEIANLCENIGANISDVSTGMGFDPRIGEKFLKPGIGYGGSCFPKDTKALHWLSSFNDVELKTVKAAIEVNDQQKLKLLKKAHTFFDSFDGLTIAVLGLTFKPGTDDVREAPSLVNVPIFLDDGAVVRVYDPVGEENFKNALKINNDNLIYGENLEETLKNADLCFIFTEWPEIQNMTSYDYIQNMKTPYIFDGRNCYKQEDMSETYYYSIGR